MNNERKAYDFRLQNNKIRYLDNFYVSFLRLPENTSNILGASLQRMTRPRIEFEPIRTRVRGHTYLDKGDIKFGEVTMIFLDDEESVTSTLLNLQAMRQLNRHTDIFGDQRHPDWRDYMFDCKCELFNSFEKVTETYILRGCLILGIEYTENTYTDDQSNSEITVTLGMNDIEIILPEKYEELMQWSDETVKRMESQGKIKFTP